MAESCPDCDAVFSRDEHLQRHRMGHLGLRPFSCGECGATFSRKDVLTRHMQIHDPSEAPSKHRRMAYVAQACLQCGKTKQRCDGQLPCSRCTSKELECSYAALRNRRTSKRTQRLALDHSKSSRPAISAQTEQEVTNSLYVENQPAVSPLHVGELSETGLVALSCWPSAEIGLTAPILCQPPLAPEPNLGSLFDPLESFQGFGPNHIGSFWELEDHLLHENEFLNLPTPSPLSLSLPEPAFEHVDRTYIPTPASSEPEVERLDTEAPTPSFTQTFQSPCSSYENLNESTTSERFYQDSDALRAEDYCHVPRLMEDVYETMTAFFARYNCDDEYWTLFASTDFPSITHMNAFIQVYFEDFHPLLPFLHKATFAPTKDKWLLSLGIAAVGCIFSKTKSSRKTFFILQEFLRRAIHVQSERVRNSLPDIQFVQAVLLNQVGMMFSAQPTFTEAVPTTMALLDALCQKMACYTNFDGFGLQLKVERMSHKNWTSWIKEESLRRLFYSVWILNCQYSCFWSGPEIVTIDCLRLSAPSDSSLWEASCRETWQKKHNESLSKSVPFRDMLLEFYRTRKISNPDDFNTLLLNIGVKYHAERLRHAPVYLNILQEHVKALPQTKLSSAVESFSHSLSLFVYLPVRELYAFSGWRVSRSQMATSHAKLRTWIQTKSEARTALVHACKAWSMIRKRKTGAQHEPMSFLLAAVMIWAWTELGNRPQVEDLDLLSTVRLDEDDGRLSAWVANNEDKRLYLGGVGGLWEQGASKRLIDESVRVLKSLDWPQTYILTLTLRAHYRSFYGQD